MLFAATEIGAFACDLQTGEWTDLFDAGVPDQAFWSVEWVDDFARFASYGRGIWDFTPTTNVGMESFKEQAIVYPNPASDVIKYDLPDNVTIVSVTNINGKELYRSNENNGVINISGWNNGTVFLTSFDGKQKKSYKIIIAH